MTVIAIFNRANHPWGYGNCPDYPFWNVWPAPEGHTEGHRGAHGYVTWIVECDNWAQFLAVKEKLSVWSDWDNRNDQWYSGPLDLVAVWEGYISTETKLLGGQLNRFNSDREWISIGDNRALAWRKAEDILKS